MVGEAQASFFESSGVTIRMTTDGIRENARREIRVLFLEFADEYDHQFLFERIERSEWIRERTVYLLRFCGDDAVPTSFADALGEIIAFARSDELRISHATFREPTPIFLIRAHDRDHERTDHAAAPGLINAGVDARTRVRLTHAGSIVGES